MVQTGQKHISNIEVNVDENILYKLNSPASFHNLGRFESSVYVGRPKAFINWTGERGWTCIDFGQEIFVLYSTRRN